MNFKVLAVSAHPDDIELEAGGTLAKLSNAGYEITSLVLTSGGYKGASGTLYESTDRKKEANDAAKILGIKEVRFFNNISTKLSTSARTIGLIDSVIDELKPDILITPHQFDSHQDHRAAGEMGLAAARQGRVRNILSPIPLPYRPSPYAFKPQMYFDISSTIEAKLSAARAHKSQYEKYGNELLIDRLKSAARYYGWAQGMQYAECFEVIRMDGSLLRGNCAEVQA